MYMERRQDYVIMVAQAASKYNILLELAGFNDLSFQKLKMLAEMMQVNV